MGFSLFLQSVFLLGELFIELGDSTSTVFSDARELIMLLLLLLQHVFLEHLQALLFFFEAFLFNSDLSIQLKLELTFGSHQVLFALPKLLVSLFQISLYDFLDGHSLLLKLVQNILKL